MSFALSTQLNHSAQQIISRLFEEQFLRQEIQRYGAELSQWEEQNTGAQRTASAVVRIDAGALPAMVAKFVGPVLALDIELVAQGQELNVRAKTQKFPVLVATRLLFAESGSGCTVSGEGAAECSVPLVGKKIAQALESEGERTLVELLKYVDQSC